MNLVVENMTEQKRVSIVKQTIKAVEMQPTELQKIFANHAFLDHCPRL